MKALLPFYLAAALVAPLAHAQQDDEGRWAKRG